MIYRVLSDFNYRLFDYYVLPEYHMNFPIRVLNVLNLGGNKFKIAFLFSFLNTLDVLIKSK